jgi:hypothetical protein
MSNEFMKQLRKRADALAESGGSVIAGGTPGEPTLAEWDHSGVHVVRRPADEQNILRISIGGGDDTPEKLNYCTFRGDPSKCAGLLRKALAAIEAGE